LGKLATTGADAEAIGTIVAQQLEMVQNELLT